MLKLESRSDWATASGLEPIAGGRQRHVPGTLRPRFMLRALWKSGSDRATLQSVSIEVELAAYLERLRAQNEHDLARRAAEVDLPGALSKKVPNAGREWPRQ